MKDAALRMARKILENSMGYHQANDEDIGKVLPIIDAALAQPEQEPVAWIIEYEVCAGGKNRGSSLTKFDYVWHKCSFVSEDKDAEIDAIKWRNRQETPLYTTPQQRKPLTDEQMFEMAEIAWRHGWASCRDAEYVGEEAEDERWGMVGAEVVQDMTAHDIKE